jgi:hypothetical protein
LQLSHKRVVESADCSQIKQDGGITISAKALRLGFNASNICLMGL